MKYPRPVFKQEGIEVETRAMMFSPMPMEVPVIEYPITPLENFKLAAERKTPMWLPNSLLDFDANMSGFMHKMEGPPSGPIFGGTERSEFTDDFGCQWLFVPEAGGPMLKPGTQFMDDITEWETKVKFPDLSTRDWKGFADDYKRDKFNPNKVMHINIGQGCTERLVALLGGYTDAMVAMAVEPEAIRAFFERFVDYMIESFDILADLYPINLITYHDDWGSEKDTFFSEAMMESMVLEPTKRLVKHIKDRGAYFELHSCGRIERFVPYMIDMGIDFLQIQRRANDMPMLKEKYGDKIGFCAFIEGMDIGAPMPSLDEYLAKVRNTVDLYGKNGGAYSSIFAPDPETMWAGTFELYCYSREFYDNERG